MKIRIKGNAVRLRLTRSEVEAFCRKGYFMERTDFNGRTFSYALQSVESISELRADFENDVLTVYFPSKERPVWQNTERVGYENTMLLKNGKQLQLLVEKDFVCMDETVEDQSDNYPNPSMKKKEGQS